MKAHKLKAIQKQLIYSGRSIPVVFWATTVLCGTLLGEYNHISRLVSELGAVGTRTQHVFTAGLVLCSILSLLFVVGLYGACRDARINSTPVLIILSYSFSIAGAAIFPLPLELHWIFGLPSILLVLSPLLGFVFWRGVRPLAGIKLMSVLSFLIMLLGFLAFFPEALENFSGLKQRFFHLGWSVWFVYLSYGFAGLLKGGNQEILSVGQGITE